MDRNIMTVSNKKGFSLVEIMIALAISGIVSAGMYAAYTSLQRINQSQDQIVEMQQNLRGGLDALTRDLRTAGYAPREQGGIGLIPLADNGGVDVNTISFTRIADEDNIDNDGDGQIDEPDEIQAVQYTLENNDSGIFDLKKQTGRIEEDDTIIWDNLPPRNQQPLTLINNVQQLEFLYTLVDGATKLNPTDDELEQIRSMQISILVRASGVSLKYTNTETYTAASGASWPGPAPDNIFDDSFRRRMQIVTVHCRNIGRRYR
ncbi:MAG: prepilin-type N-terminal cleavage/methylation domain-containing protein [Candidatus Electrothrix sp. AR4]|nr:prepilin-type N-terminal cleavage/methylation domain-containing protein [Candidatus Electrothrix sp. AR4]